MFVALDNKNIPLGFTANQKRISYDRLLGEFIGTLEGICANEIPKELKDKLKLKIEELKKI